ncbi:MAG: LytR C-terminal domain-containing protein [Chlorobi bacterium]|nr:LytR C-terminal domain-containing protein [Chlorobiota bacterium]
MGSVRRIVRWLWVTALGVAVLVLGASLVWRVFIRPPVEPVIEPESGRVVQLRVLNGAGVPELARRVQQYLRRRGFDVVEAANAATTVERSYVADHLGDSIAVERVLYAVGLPPDAVRRQIDSDLVIHCSLVIGTDWQSLRPFR